MKRNNKNESQLSLDFTTGIDMQIAADQKRMAQQEAEQEEMVDRNFRTLCFVASVVLIFAQIIL